MRILVCISNVPDTTTKITFTPENKKFNTAGVQFVINPYDEYALTRAIELKEAQGGTVTVINVGEADSDANIRKALAIRLKNNCHCITCFFNNRGCMPVVGIILYHTILFCYYNRK